MKDKALEWILGTLSIATLGLMSFVGVSLDTRITKASDQIISVEDKRRDNERDIAVMKEILSQVNNRTYEMEQQLDRIEKKIFHK